MDPGSHVGFQISTKKKSGRGPSSEHFWQVWKSSCQKPLSQLNCDFAGMIIGWSCTKIVNRLPIGNSRWPPWLDYFHLFFWNQGPSSEHFWQVWLKSVQRFQRRRFKCEKLTDGRTTDAYPWQKLTWPIARWAKNKTIGRSFTNFVFFMLIVIPRWLPLQDIVFT
jgi:hypothetical protein